MFALNTFLDSIMVIIIIITAIAVTVFLFVWYSCFTSSIITSTFVLPTSCWPKIRQTERMQWNEIDGKVIMHYVFFFILLFSLTFVICLFDILRGTYISVECIAPLVVFCILFHITSIIIIFSLLFFACTALCKRRLPYWSMW